MPLVSNEASSQSPPSPKDLPPLPTESMDLTAEQTTSVRPLPPSLFYTFSYCFFQNHNCTPHALLPCPEMYPKTVVSDSGAPVINNRMDLGTYHRSFPNSVLILPDLDDPQSDGAILAAEGIARPTAVRLPYALIPGMDLSSSAYQKATALLSKVATEATTNFRPLPTASVLLPGDLGNLSVLLSRFPPR